MISSHSWLDSITRLGQVRWGPSSALLQTLGHTSGFGECEGLAERVREKFKEGKRRRES